MIHVCKACFTHANFFRYWHEKFSDKFFNSLTFHIAIKVFSINFHESLVLVFILSRFEIILCGFLLKFSKKCLCENIFTPNTPPCCAKSVSSVIFWFECVYIGGMLSRYVGDTLGMCVREKRSKKEFALILCVCVCVCSRRQPSIQTTMMMNRRGETHRIYALHP